MFFLFFHFVFNTFNATNTTHDAVTWTPLYSSTDGWNAIPVIPLNSSSSSSNNKNTICIILYQVNIIGEFRKQEFLMNSVIFVLKYILSVGIYIRNIAPFISIAHEKNRIVWFFLFIVVQKRTKLKY